MKKSNNKKINLKEKSKRSKLGGETKEDQISININILQDANPNKKKSEIKNSSDGFIKTAPQDNWKEARAAVRHKVYTVAIWSVCMTLIMAFVFCVFVGIWHILAPPYLKWLSPEDSATIKN